MSEAEQLVEEMEVLRHMVGAKSREPGYRNHFNAEPGHHSYAALERLLARGLIRTGHRGYFHATLEGCKAIGLNDKQIKRAFE